MDKTGQIQQLDVKGEETRVLLFFQNCHSDGGQNKAKTARKRGDEAHVQQLCFPKTSIGAIQEYQLT